LRALTAQAVDCSGALLDGVSYRHHLMDRAGRLDAVWFNPLPPGHRSQIRLVEAYEGLLRVLGPA
jgi:hypothetical protein